MGLGPLNKDGRRDTLEKSEGQARMLSGVSAY